MALHRSGLARGMLGNCRVYPLTYEALRFGFGEEQHRSVFHLRQQHQHKNNNITMAGNFPPKLKAADLSRFAARAAQLEKLKPVVTYWCMEQHLPSNKAVPD